MIVTITAKGQITIPKQLRRKFHLSAGDKLEFDEEAPVLLARRAADQESWSKTIAEWRESSSQQLTNHPWEKSSSAAMIDDLRGGPAEP